LPLFVENKVPKDKQPEKKPEDIPLVDTARAGDEVNVEDIPF
jgi:hypothetical protein